MVRYRRNKTGNPDDLFFFSIVTENRLQRFSSPGLLNLVINVMKRVRARFGIKFRAWAVLPDHLHWLIAPRGADYSKVVYSFKRGVGAELKKLKLIGKGDKIWQDRYWEHTIKSDEEYIRCVEYIHYNPVKHGWVKTPRDWRFSSFHEYVKRGIYPEDWAHGGNIEVPGSEFDR